MKTSYWALVWMLAAATFSATTTHAYDLMESMAEEYASRGDDKAMVLVARRILSPDAKKGYLQDMWGATSFLKMSADKGNREAADLLREKHKTAANASAYLLKGLLDSCPLRDGKPFAECKPFATSADGNRAAITYIGRCFKKEDGIGPNAYVNAKGGLTYCLGSLDRYAESLSSGIVADAFDVDAELMADVFMAAGPGLQGKLAPAVQKESAATVGRRFLQDKNFVQARFWFKKADDQEGLAQVDKKEKALAEFEEAKRKALPETQWVDGARSSPPR